MPRKKSNRLYYATNCRSRRLRNSGTGLQGCSGALAQTGKQKTTTLNAIVAYE